MSLCTTSGVELELGRFRIRRCNIEKEFFSYTKFFRATCEGSTYESDAKVSEVSLEAGVHYQCGSHIRTWTVLASLRNWNNPRANIKLCRMLEVVFIALLL